jgi:hypothetical protein
LNQPTTPLPPATTDRPDHSVLGHSINVDFARDVLAATFETMPLRPNEGPADQTIHEAATYTALMSLHARDPIDLMFAAHVVASHHATMECFRRAMCAANNADAAARMHRSATMLSRMMADTVKTLDARQATPDRLGAAPGGKTP